MNRMSMQEFPKTAMNRKASDVYEAAAVGPVSLSEHGTSRFVIMSRRFYDEHFGRGSAPIVTEPARPSIDQVKIENVDLDDEEAQPLIEELERLIGSKDWG
jgi:hypothetical protein